MLHDPARAGQLAEVDAATILRTYEEVLWGWVTTPPIEECERVGLLLRGHVQLLLPELTAYAPRMRGEQQRTAVHVIVRTRRMLEDGAGTAAQIEAPHLRDPATQCRALLTLYQHPGPLDDQPADAVVGGER